LDGFGIEGHDVWVRRSEPTTGEEFARNEAKDEVVGYKAAGLDGGFGLDAQRGATLDVAPEEVAHADGLELGEAFEETVGLGAFADAGGADEDNASCSLKAHARRCSGINAIEVVKGV